MRVHAVTLLLVSLALAGCMGGDAPVEPETPAATGNNSIIVDENRPDPVAGDVATGPEAAPDIEATLDKVPELKVGEWWRIRMTSPLDGTSVEVVRVLAKIDGEHYVFGMPHEGWYKEAVIYHVPFFGDVSRADLSGHAHNIPFQPLQFPLTDGATWVTNFENTIPLTATVKVTSPTTAEITYTAKNDGPLAALNGAEETVVVKAIYDATIHEIRYMDVGFLQYEVVAHGYDFEGWVTVPRGEKLVFFNGRITGVLDPALQPAAPMEEVVIDEDFNRVTFVQLVGFGLEPNAHGKGVYKETVTAPDGTVYETTVTAESGYKVVFFENSAPKGTWKLEHVVAGPGYAFTEGIAYHQYDISVPDGAIRTDHSHEVVR